MIDFNKGEERLNKYLGSEKKTTVLLNNELYMLKYPDPVRSKKLKDVLSYKNNQFSEHIGCSIFKSCDFNTQDTVLGDFTDTLGKSKVVVGCKDFTQNGGDLYEFAKLAGQTMVDDGKLGATIENVYNIINSSNLIKNKESIINGFWDMFVIDALIANPDRHFGNWGVFEKNGNVQLAPIYDCGSSLGALLDDNNMTSLLEKPNLFKNQEFNVTSCYSLDGKKIFYHEIFKNPPKELRESIKLIVPKISIDKISAIIEGVPQMSDIRKVYLKKAVFLRYEQILLVSLKKILLDEKSTLENSIDKRDKTVTQATQQIINTPEVLINDKDNNNTDSHATSKKVDIFAKIEQNKSKVKPNTTKNHIHHKDRYD